MKRVFMLILAVLMCLALAACAQPDEEMYYEEIPVSGVPMRDTTVYFTDDSGYLVPVTAQVSWSQQMREEALALLCAEAPQGLHSLLPEGTAAALYVNGDTAVVDLPAAAFEVETAAAEQNVVAGVVCTLTGFAQTERVIITVDGVSSVTLPHGTELAGAFTEPALNPMGEAREFSAVAYLPHEDGHIVPVTLYFDEKPEIRDVLSELNRRQFEGLQVVLGEDDLPRECVVDAAGNLTLSFAEGTERLASLSSTELKSLFLTCLAFDNVTDIDILVDGADAHEDAALPTFANTYAIPEE